MKMQDQDSTNDIHSIFGDYIIKNTSFQSFSDQDWQEFLSLDGHIETEFDPQFPYSPILAKKKYLLGFPSNRVELWLFQPHK
jgi:hypothetical protein